MPEASHFLIPFPTLGHLLIQKLVSDQCIKLLALRFWTSSSSLPNSQAKAFSNSSEVTAAPSAYARTSPTAWKGVVRAKILSGELSQLQSVFDVLSRTYGMTILILQPVPEQSSVQVYS